MVTASPDTDLETIAERLESEQVGAIVITDDEKPVGIVTDRDIALALTDYDDPASTSVEGVMTEDPATLRSDEEPIEISRAIEEHNVRRFPVVDEDGKPEGIATFDDLVATLGEQLDNVADTIEAQSPAYSP
ncbi:putative signal transduction protein with CBS domains [Halopiger xanaduensis SH-6]|uniref:Putative signal transduction protein with CBS domains n=1 Tax=Halopiger xanaduensis (strain DSM 18323 / JCM 14033 / SH-6) TaxID=797210 RepID=F8D3P4_HALXS|nr:putative signal transduction protein with CBS domains [Halopiger xanaduensis SH-6]